MKRLQSLPPERLAIAEARLRNPRPGTKIEAAKIFGIDLTLLIEKLRLSPEERVCQMHSAARVADQVRNAAKAQKVEKRLTGSAGA